MSVGSTCSRCNAASKLYLCQDAGFCRKCFQNYCERKYKAVVGKRNGITPRTRVVILRESTLSFAVLEHLASLHPNRFVPTYVTIADEGGWQVDSSASEVTVGMHSFLSSAGDDRRALAQELIKSSGMPEALRRVIARRVLLSVAKTVGALRVVVARTKTACLESMLFEMSSGSGVNCVHSAGESDRSMADDVFFINGLCQLTRGEVEDYAGICGLAGRPEEGGFVSLMQSTYPSTTNTGFRSCAKLVAKGRGPRCILCLNRVSSTSALDFIGFSLGARENDLYCHRCWNVLGDGVPLRELTPLLTKHNSSLHGHSYLLSSREWNKDILCVMGNKYHILA